MTRSEFNVRLRFPAERASLARVRAVVEAVLNQESGFSGDEVQDIVLGLQETLSNVTRHAYAGAGGTIDVTLRSRPGGFDARVRDRGPAFDPTTADAEGPGRPRDGGYGLMLVRRTMDRISYQRRGDENVVRLTRSARPRLKSRRVSAR